MKNDAGLRTDRAASATCSKGLFPLTLAGGGGASSSESGTCCIDVVFATVLRGGTRLAGGGLRRRTVVDWVSFSYSTEVLRGILALREVPEAHESFGLDGGILGSPVAA